MPDAGLLDAEGEAGEASSRTRCVRARCRRGCAPLARSLRHGRARDGDQDVGIVSRAGRRAARHRARGALRRVGLRRVRRGRGDHRSCERRARDSRRFWPTASPTRRPGMSACPAAGRSRCSSNGSRERTTRAISMRFSPRGLRGLCWSSIRISRAGGACSIAMPRRSTPKLRPKLSSNGECVLDETPGARRFLNALAPPVRVILVGAGHIAQVLADLATRLGFQVAVVDPRTAFSTAERFAGVPLSHDWPEAALPALGLDNRTAVVTLAHEARLDDETLLLALRSPLLLCRRAWIAPHAREAGRAAECCGDVGSPRSRASMRRSALRIGAKGPGEIAVSILAGVDQGPARSLTWSRLP